MKSSDESEGQNQLVIETFDTKARTYAAGYLGQSSTAHSFVIRRTRVYELVGDRPPGPMLDVGCGPGVTVEHFVRRGFDVHGVDVAPEMIAECRRVFGGLEAAHFSVGAIEALQFPDGAFDVVTSMGVVEYVPDDEVAIEEMARVTRPGGLVIVTLPNAWSPYRIWQRTAYRGARALVRRLAGRGPAPPEVSHREYRERSYCQLLSARGLRVVDVVYYNFNLLLFPLDRLLPFLVVPLSRALERFGRGPCRWLGTGFVVKAERL
jgi:ubiquinone/menaquinone biosynthesis C-methylase UbiE